MLLDIFTHPIMFAIVLPVLLIAVIVVALLPDQDDIKFEIKSYKPSVPPETSDATQVIPVVKNYGHYDTFDTKRVGAIFGDEMERQMIARVIAYEWLLEMREVARKNFALCA